MCGAFYIRQSPTLRERYGVTTQRDLFDFTGDAVIDPRRILDGYSGSTTVFRPTDEVLVIAQTRDRQLVCKPARWWLLMKPDETGNPVPDQSLATFNSRMDKVLSSGRTVHTMKPRSFRAMIAVSGYLEWLNKLPHAIARADGEPLLLGAMVKAYPQPDGGYTLGTSIVTLPGNPKLAHIHEKSVPLMLEDEQIEVWLDRTIPNQDLQSFRNSRLRHDMTLQPWRSIKSLEPVADPELIEGD